MVPILHAHVWLLPHKCTALPHKCTWMPMPHFTGSSSHNLDKIGFVPCVEKLVLGHVSPLAELNSIRPTDIWRVFKVVAPLLDQHAVICKDLLLLWEYIWMAMLPFQQKKSPHSSRKRVTPWSGPASDRPRRTGVAAVQAQVKASWDSESHGVF